MILTKGFRYCICCVTHVEGTIHSIGDLKDAMRDAVCLMQDRRHAETREGHLEFSELEAHFKMDPPSEPCIKETF